MLDIVLFRAKGGNPDLVRESQRRRYGKVELVDQVIELDNQWRTLRGQLDEANARLNKLNKQIGEKKKNKEDASELLTQQVPIEKEIKQLEEQCVEVEKRRDSTLIRIGNLVHESVPVSNDETNNAVVHTHGTFEGKDNFLFHHEVLHRIGGYDPERGVVVAGHRGYFLTGWGLRLQLALVQYGLDFLLKRNYQIMQTPFFMRKEVMAETAQLEQFDEELYKVTGDGEDDKYLIATSEQPISAFHRGEWIDPKLLPLRYGGYSSCFRKEAGAHGKDTWGIFRVHQFEKVEQFCITAPEDSWQMHEEMLRTSEEFYQSLGIAYRVVTIVSAELNNAAAKKYDLEGWFPAYKQHRELVSCSNCTDYQSRRLEIRFGNKKGNEKEKKYVHMLNSTLCATTRTISCILENFQTPDGVLIPDALRPYLHVPDDQKLIPYIKPAPKRK